MRNMLAGALLFVGGSLVTTAIPISEALFPNYSVANNYISDLGGPITLAEHPPGVVVIHQPGSIMFILAVLLLGVSALMSAKTISSESSAKWFRRFLYLYGIGALVVAASYAPYYTYANQLIRAPITSVPIAIGLGAAAHGIGSLFVFLFGGLSAIASFRIVKRPLNYFFLFSGVVTIVALVFSESSFTIGLGVGGIERLAAYPALIWTIAFGAYRMGVAGATTKSSDEPA